VGTVPRPIRLALAGVAAAALAACGGGTGAPGSGAPASAELVSADVPAFVSIDGDFDSEQWAAVEELLSRFPSGADSLESLFDELSEGGVDFWPDLKLALGPEVGIALTELSQEGEPPAVLLTQPPDPAKLEALLAEAEEPPVWRIVDGWYVVAEDGATIDRALADGDSLAETEAFETAMDELPGDALARVYLDGQALTEAAQASSENVGAPPLGVGAGVLASVSLAVSAEPQGFRLDGVARSEGAPQLEAAPSELLGVVPADALAFGAFHGLDDGLSQLLDAAAEDSAELDQAAALLGISLEDDVLPLFAGESGLYLRAGEPVPEVTLLLTPEDPAQALETVEELLAAVSTFGALGSQDGDGWTSYPPATVTIEGVEAKQVPLGEDLVLTYGVVDGRLVVSTSERGIADVVGDGPRLADDPTFQEAEEAAGMPDQTLGLLYVNLTDGAGLLETLGALEEAEPGTRANLDSLSYLVLHATGGGDDVRFGGFLGIG
jgi:hypothetical protein